MANKQINELTELTDMADSDLILVYDTDEVGSEKTKKYSVSSLIDTTNSWILIKSGTFSNEAISNTTVIPSDGVKYKIIVDGVFADDTWLQSSLGNISSGWVNYVGFTNSAYFGSPTANNRVYGEFILPPLDNGNQKMINGNLYRTGTSVEQIHNYNTSTVTVSSFNVLGYKSSQHQNFTGTVKIFAQ